jgi:hypothetical protein
MSRVTLHCRGGAGCGFRNVALGLITTFVLNRHTSTALSLFVHMSDMAESVLGLPRQCVVLGEILVLGLERERDRLRERLEGLPVLLQLLETMSSERLAAVHYKNDLACTSGKEERRQMYRCRS